MPSNDDQASNTPERPEGHSEHTPSPTTPRRRPRRRRTILLAAATAVVLIGGGISGSMIASANETDRMNAAACTKAKNTLETVVDDYNAEVDAGRAALTAVVDAKKNADDYAGRLAGALAFVAGYSDDTARAALVTEQETFTATVAALPTEHPLTLPDDAIATPKTKAPANTCAAAVKKATAPHKTALGDLRTANSDLVAAASTTNVGRDALAEKASTFLGTLAGKAGEYNDANGNVGETFRAQLTAAVQELQANLAAGGNGFDQLQGYVDAVNALQAERARIDAAPPADSTTPGATPPGATKPGATRPGASKPAPSKPGAAPAPGKPGGGNTNPGGGGAAPAPGNPGGGGSAAPAPAPAPSYPTAGEVAARLAANYGGSTNVGGSCMATNSGTVTSTSSFGPRSPQTSPNYSAVRVSGSGSGSGSGGTYSVTWYACRG